VNWLQSITSLTTYSRASIIFCNEGSVSSSLSSLLISPSLDYSLASVSVSLGSPMLTRLVAPSLGNPSQEFAFSLALTTLLLTSHGYIFKDIRISLSHPALLFTDNIRALHLTVN
uniref:Uncharacterized protein n=1 Tax=Solanum lycopersicum TaxID=4081 RepID=A0A3Q7GJ12_SOLLC